MNTSMLPIRLRTILTISNRRKILKGKSLCVVCLSVSVFVYLYGFPTAANDLDLCSGLLRFFNGVEYLLVVHLYSVLDAVAATVVFDDVVAVAVVASVVFCFIHFVCLFQLNCVILYHIEV